VGRSHDLARNHRVALRGEPVEEDDVVEPGTVRRQIGDADDASARLQAVKRKIRFTFLRLDNHYRRNGSLQRSATAFKG
jgi:hypothetical protein